jgi:hypothetical protein
MTAQPASIADASEFSLDESIASSGDAGGEEDTAAMSHVSKYTIVPSSSNRPKLVLTERDAIDIFRLKEKHGFPTAHAASCFLAGKYHVSSKAIRDVWSGRSWLKTTYDLWEPKERPPRRFCGRPKGKKDNKPRKFSPHANQQRSLHRGRSAISKGINAQQDAGLTRSNFETLAVAGRATACHRAQVRPLPSEQAQRRSSVGRRRSSWVCHRAQPVAL